MANGAASTHGRFPICQQATQQAAVLQEDNIATAMCAPLQICGQQTSFCNLADLLPTPVSHAGGTRGGGSTTRTRS